MVQLMYTCWHLKRCGKSLTHSSKNVKILVITCVLINNSKCKMQPMNNNFNILKVDGSTHVPC